MITDEVLKEISQHGCQWQTIAMEMAAELLKLREEKRQRESWDDAPEWVQWGAVDEDGRSFYFTEKPIAGESHWYCSANALAFERKTLDWQTSLEKRP